MSGGADFRGERASIRAVLLARASHDERSGDICAGVCQVWKEGCVVGMDNGGNPVFEHRESIGLYILEQYPRNNVITTPSAQLHNKLLGR